MQGQLFRRNPEMSADAIADQVSAQLSAVRASLPPGVVAALDMLGAEGIRAIVAQTVEAVRAEQRAAAPVEPARIASAAASLPAEGMSTLEQDIAQMAPHLKADQAALLASTIRTVISEQLAA